MSGFACLRCGEPSTEVRDSRPRESGGIRRRRRCGKCGARFTTLEVRAEDADTIMRGVDDAEPAVVKQATQAVNILGRLDGPNRALAMHLLRRLDGQALSRHVYDFAPAEAAE